MPVKCEAFAAKVRLWLASLVSTWLAMCRRHTLYRCSCRWPKRLTLHVFIAIFWCFWKVQLRGKRLAFVFISSAASPLQRVVFDRRRFDASSPLGFPAKGPALRAEAISVQFWTSETFWSWRHICFIFVCCFTRRFHQALRAYTSRSARGISRLVCKKTFGHFMRVANFAHEEVSHLQISSRLFETWAGHYVWRCRLCQDGNSVQWAWLTQQRSPLPSLLVLWQDRPSPAGFAARCARTLCGDFVWEEGALLAFAWRDEVMLWNWFFA